MEGDNARDADRNRERASNATSNEMIQISTELLTSLMATIEQLKQSLDQVQGHNVVILSEFKALRVVANRLPGFFRFPLLPPEIRQMIVSRRFLILSILNVHYNLGSQNKAPDWALDRLLIPHSGK